MKKLTLTHFQIMISGLAAIQKLNYACVVFSSVTEHCTTAAEFEPLMDVTRVYIKGRLKSIAKDARKAKHE